MKPFTSFSQAGQDRYALAMCPDGHRFIDIGCCHPIEISNTYGLECIGWDGLLIDNDLGAVKLCLENRKAETVQMDATVMPWSGWTSRIHDPVDYLSLDVDAATLPALTNLLNAGIRFRCATIEHDSYRFGPGPRDAMRAILERAGYLLICADVCSSDGIPYEDWWVDPKLVPIERYERFICHDKKWTEIFPA